MRGRDLGMIFQEPLTRLNPLMRISEHFSETLKTHDRSISKAEIERRSLEVLRLMGIPPTRYHAYPHEFSGGMRQRLMIALTLVLRPAFVVADEPTTALDVLVEAQIIRILHDLRRELPHRAAADHPQPRHHRGGLRPGRGDVRRARSSRSATRARCSPGPSTPTPVSCCARPSRCRPPDSTTSTGAPPDLVEPPPGCHFHPRCPDAMKICADPAPRRARAQRRQPGGVLGRRLPRTDWRPTYRSPSALHSNGRRSPLPTKPEVDRLSGPRSETVLDIDDLAVHFQLQGGALSRLLGLKARSRQGRGRCQREPATRRGARPGGRVRQRQDHARSGLARPGARYAVARSPTTPRTAGTVASPQMRGAELRQLRTDLQMVFQDPHAALNPSMTIEEAVGHPLVIHKIASGAELKKRVAAALERVGLAPVERFLTKYPSDLSGGQKQRAVIARAIILDPEVLVADEPVSMLDMSVRAKILQLMLDLKQELGLTYVYITHDLAIGEVLLRPHRDHVPRPHRRDRADRGDLRQSPAPLHQGTAQGDPRARPRQAGPARPAARRDP